MLIQDVVDPKATSNAKNEPKYLTSYEAKYKVNKAILAEIVRHYIEREARLGFNMNKIYGIIWVQFTLGIQ